MRQIHIYLWSIVMDLEDWLYPWKKDTPPSWAIDRFNLDSGLVEDIDNETFYFDWLKAQEQKIQQLEKNIISLSDQIQNIRTLKS